MEIYKPPSYIRELDFSKSLFLAGSIEDGKADDWQKEMEEALKDDEGIILNPRREDWDSSWEQTKENPNFKGQVKWELYGLELCKIIVMYFQPGTKSPISLLELGLHAKSEKMIVCCPDGYMKKGNVDIVCEYYGIPVVNTFEELVESVRHIVT